MPRTYGKSKGKAKQTRLSFVPSQFASDGNDEEHSRNANVRYTHPSLSTVRHGRSIGKKESTPVPFVEAQPSPEGSLQSEAGAEAQVDGSSQRSLRKKEKKKKKRSSKKSTSKSNTPLAASPSPPPVPPSPPLATQDSDSDSDLEIIHSARKNTRDRTAKRKRVDSSEPEAPRVSEESDADEIVARPRRKLRRGGAPQPVIVDDDSSEEEEPRAAHSKSPSVPHTPRRDSAQDRIDIEEDLEDLQDSVVKASRTRGNVANSARAQRLRYLEALRRRRARNKEDDEDDQLSPQQEFSGSEDNEDEGEEKAPVRQPQFRSWANESESSDVESTIDANEDLDRYEDDFVLEDDDDKLGAPSGLDDMPIEFSRHSYKQLKDYFQDAVEWMVHNQLNPAFPRSDPVYRVAFDKLETEVRGRAGSQLVSSVWNTDFRRALLARPHIETTAYPTEFAHPCDACNRSGHPASSDLKLYGKAYSLETLEPLAAADSDDDDDDDDDKQSDSDEESNQQEQDRDGYTLPDEDKHFYLGSHCKKMAEMAHTLTHWRIHLNEWVVEHLKITGQFSDKKILKRSGYSQKKKNKSAARAFNKMVESGEVKKLWRDFHINLRVAREEAGV
ncbi:uncharacterized protein BDV17DRAFT_13260 [Aspergillus undulatus]|uniref:uncharacterized protein n=1 Tax=Aspergillus undulatus TaxID=1810928 RepID=UPI003CCE2A5B